MERTSESNNNTRQVQVAGGAVHLNGSLSLPQTAQGIVLCPFVGANRQQGYREVVQPLQVAGLATLLFNLLTPEDEELDKQTGFFDSNVSIFSQRILAATNWFTDNFDTQPRTFKIGYFASGASAAGALIAAAERPDAVQALVSCGGRPDLAEQYLPRVSAPSLFLVGANDSSAVEMHRTALSQFKAVNQLEIIPGTEEGKPDGVERLDENVREKVIDFVRQWFAKYLLETPAG